MLLEGFFSKLVTNVYMLRIYYENILANCDGNMYLPIFNVSPKSRITSQVARKIAACDQTFTKVNVSIFSL